MTTDQKPTECCFCCGEVPLSWRHADLVSTVSFRSKDSFACNLLNSETDFSSVSNNLLMITRYE
jgi:hypothetical protein